MTAIPIAVLIFVVTVMVGGPKELLSLIESYLRMIVDRVAQLI
jgi:hypothetical protein